MITSVVMLKPVIFLPSRCQYGFGESISAYSLAKQLLWSLLPHSHHPHDLRTPGRFSCPTSGPWTLISPTVVFNNGAQWFQEEEQWPTRLLTNLTPNLLGSLLIRGHTSLLRLPAHTTLGQKTVSKIRRNHNVWGPSKGQRIIAPGKARGLGGSDIHHQCPSINARTVDPHGRKNNGPTALLAFQLAALSVSMTSPPISSLLP
jgi:hypothetical protein